MPTNIKISVSVIVALVGMGAFFLEQQFGDRVVGVVAIFLAAFMIIYIWVLPDAKWPDNPNEGGVSCR